MPHDTDMPDSEEGERIQADLDVGRDLEWTP